MLSAQPSTRIMREPDWGQAAATCICARLRSSVHFWRWWRWDCGYAAVRCKPFLESAGEPRISAKAIYGTDAECAGRSAGFGSDFRRSTCIPGMVARRGDRNFRDTFWGRGALARDRAARDVRARAAGCDRATAAEITPALEAQQANQRAASESK